MRLEASTDSAHVRNGANPRALSLAELLAPFVGRGHDEAVTLPMCDLFRRRIAEVRYRPKPIIIRRSINEHGPPLRQNRRREVRFAINEGLKLQELRRNDALHLKAMGAVL